MKIFFDGSCRPNPGPIDIAVVIGGETIVRKAVAHGDNNQAEWLALLLAVDVARERGARDPVFVGDSALVIAQASGRQRCRSVHLQTYLTSFTERAATLGRIRLRQVPRTRNLAGIVLDARWLR